MKLGVHITFYFVEARLKYVHEVLDAIRSLPAEVRIFIYSNKNLDEYLEPAANIIVMQYNYWKIGKVKLASFFDNPYLKWFVHPYHLSWENRKIVEQTLNDFDAQVYLEDDIRFDTTSFKYWMKYQPICKRYGYNLGFYKS